MVAFDTCEPDGRSPSRASSEKTRLLRGYEQPRSALREVHREDRDVVCRRARVLDADLPRSDAIGEATLEGDHAFGPPGLDRSRDLGGLALADQCGHGVAHAHHLD